MPLYDNARYAPSLMTGVAALFFNAESSLNGGNVKSERFGVPNKPGKNAEISVEIDFAADPGAFQIDLQEADEDIEAAYFAIPSAGTVNAVDGTNFRARVDLSPFVARFIRLNVVSLTNDVALTAKAYLR